MRYKKLLPYFLALILSLSFTHNALALTVTPIRLEVIGQPGETLYQDITITNEQKVPLLFYTSFANFESQGESGNPSFTDDKQDLASWMNTDSSIHLNPKESKTVKVKIVIPTTAEPGGHFAAVFFGTIPNAGKNAEIGIGAKTGTLILLSVPGNVKEGGGLIDFITSGHTRFYNTLPVAFSYRFKNDGGDRIKPVGKITMHDILYIPEDTIDANPSQGNILPGSTRRFEVDWVKHPRAKDYVAPTGAFAQFFDQAGYEWSNFAIGPYFAKINLLYGTSATRISKTVFFFVCPWQLLIILIIILFIVIWGGKKLIKRYNSHIIQKARAGMTPIDANHV